METTPSSIIESVVRSVCGRDVERLERLTGGGLNEAHRVEVADHVPVVVRIARRPEPWFTDEAQFVSLARSVDVPAPEVLGVEHLDHDGVLLSFSILRLLPGRPLDELVGALPESDLERILQAGGELLARLHGLEADRGLRHDLEAAAPDVVARATAAAEALGPDAVAAVERGVGLLGEVVASRPPPGRSLSHGDFLPKHLLIDSGTITGVIDWELAGPGPAAHDLAHWEVSAGGGLHDRADLVRRGYARVAGQDPNDAEGSIPAFAIGIALEVLGWRNPAPPERLQRCVDVINRHAAP